MSFYLDDLFGNHKTEFAMNISFSHALFHMSCSLPFSADTAKGDNPCFLKQTRVIAHVPNRWTISVCAQAASFKIKKGIRNTVAYYIYF